MGKATTNEPKHPGGRPTKLTPELIDRALAYVYVTNSQPPAWTGGYSVVPSLEGLALHLSVSRETIHTWKRGNPEFSDICEAILTEQAELLFNKGLTGDFSAPITKLMLSKHGYTEKSETDITTKGEKLEGAQLGSDLVQGIIEGLKDKTRAQ